MSESDFDENKIIWSHPDCDDEFYTLGDLIELVEIKSAILKFLGSLEDGHKDALEDFTDEMERLGVSPSPCPICGIFSSHGHVL